MVRYSVHQVYTPVDTSVERSRLDGHFDSDSQDLVELAIQARIAMYDEAGRTHPRILQTVRELVEESADQLEGQDPDAFEIILFGNNGEWFLEVTRE